MKSPLAELVGFVAVLVAVLTGGAVAAVAILGLAAAIEFLAWRPPDDAGSR